MVSRNFLPSRAAQEESYLQSLYDKGFLFFALESYHWFKDLDLRDMAPKLFCAMKSPMKVMKAPKAKAKADAKAKAKAKAKVKAEPPTTPAKSQEGSESTEVSKHDQQLFNTFLARSEDPKAESLRALYQGMARNDPKKKELVAQWKLDKSLSWHVHHEEVHSSGKSQEQTQTVGWMTRCKFLFGALY